MKLKKIHAIAFHLLLIHLANADTLHIHDFGAKGDGITDNTQIIQEVIDTCSDSGGGTVVFKSGVYLSGRVNLKSNITIELDQNSVWKGVASTSPDVYADIKEEYRYESNRAFIFAKGQENIKITGEGMIHGNGEAHDVFIPKPGIYREKRPYGICFWKCKNIVVEGIKIQSTAFWAQRYFECDNLTIRNIRVYNHSNVNNDGLDIVDCHRVIIDNCLIDSEDDALCFKSESDYGVEDVVVSSCILSSHASAIKFGTASSGYFKRINISNCIIKPSLERTTHHPYQLINGVRGILMLATDGATLENIKISNIMMDGVLSPVTARMGERNRFWRPDVEGNRTTVKKPIFRDVEISDIKAVNVGSVGSSIIGLPDSCISDFTLRNIDVYLREAGTEGDAIEAAASEKHPFLSQSRNLPAYGLYVKNVNNIDIRNFKVHTPRTDLPEFCMFFDKVDGAHIEGTEFSHPMADENQLIKYANSSHIEYKD